jgi:hypothetical protein
MNTRLYMPSDYPVLAPWWPAHGWPAVSQAILPKCGVIVEEEGKPLAVAWLYMDNSVGVSMMEWTVTNPENSAKQSLSALKVLIGAVRMLAKEFDYGVMLTSVKQPSLCRLYERCGFQKTDEGMSHLVMATKDQT